MRITNFKIGARLSIGFGFLVLLLVAMAALGIVALITRAPPGPFTPAPFGFAKMLLRKCGVKVA